MANFCTHPNTGRSHHPRTGEVLEFTAEAPAIFLETLEKGNSEKPITNRIHIYDTLVKWKIKSTVLVTVVLHFRQIILNNK